MLADVDQEAAEKSAQQVMKERDAEGIEDLSLGDPNERRTAFVERMEAAGYVVVYPGPNILQIDLDTKFQLVLFDRNYKALQSNLQAADAGQAKIADMHASKSGAPHMHITITYPREVTALERIALQACLGSDPMREMLSLLRLFRGDEQPTLFVEL